MAPYLVLSIYPIEIHQLGKHGIIVNSLAVQKFCLPYHQEQRREIKIGDR